MNRKCLLLGCNEYLCGKLEGCVNDMTDVEQYVKKEQCFEPNEIVKLLNREMTKSNVIDGLKWLTADTNSGDGRLLYYSGHGAQVPCDLEVDGLAEILCMVDMDWNPMTYITDHELVDALNMPTGVRFNFVADACHSSGLDDLTRELPRGIPKVYPGRHDCIRGCIAHKTRAVSELLNIGFISGCRSNQTSADATFGGRPNGALTYFLLKNLYVHKASSIKDIVKMVNQDLRLSSYEQEPQVHGNRVDKPFLG